MAFTGHRLLQHATRHELRYPLLIHSLMVGASHNSGDRHGEKTYACGVAAAEGGACHN